MLSVRSFRKLSLFLLLTAVSSAGFAGGGREQPAGTKAGTAGEGLSSADVEVFVSIPPQLFFIRELGGDIVEEHVLVKPGQSPHAYEPAPSQMTELAGSDLLFVVGVEFEKALLPKIESNSPGLTIVETQEGVDYRSLDQHDHGGDEDAGAKDPHIWMSPENGKIIARNMRDALISAAPEHRKVFEKNYRTLVEKIDAVDRELSEILGPLEGSTFFVFHPAFGYFADAYGLEQEAIETEGKEPGPRQLTGIIERAKAEGVEVIFVQPQFSPRAAQAVAEAIGGAVIPIDSLAEDWLENLEWIARKVKEGINR